MNIKMVSLSDLKPYENNPRHNEYAVQKVANSIKEFGFKVPLVIDKNNVIVTGHTRYKASEMLSITEVPCIVADDLTEKQIKMFRLADNKVSEFSAWDYELLTNELETLEDDFNFEEFGFAFDFDIDEDDFADILEEVPKQTEAKLKVVIDCASEQEQDSIIELLAANGYTGIKK